MDYRYFLFFVFFFYLIPINAQTPPPNLRTIKGIVLDESTGKPIMGATVATEDKKRGTISDYDGNFSLSLPSNVTVLQVSFLGYATQKVNLKGSEHLTVILREDQTMLSEVVVVGYGAQKKETLTGAIAVIGSKEILQSPTANISNALVGRIPGISSVQSSGEPGHDASTIRIRGISTLNSDGLDPLIVIDGIQSTSAMFNSLDANEIENISILKDASSTAVYGVQGANGVIIVTTKKGESGKPRISMNYRYGIAQISSKLEMLGSYEYAIFRNEAIDNDGNISLNSVKFTETELWKFRYNRDYTPTEVEDMTFLTPEQQEALKNSPALYYVSHDFFDELFGGSSPQQQFNVNLSGGSENIRYFTSVGYFSQEGIFQNAEYAGKNANSLYDRYNIRTNINVDVFKNLEMDVQFGGQFENRSGIVGQNNATDEGSRHKQMLVMILGAPPFSSGGITSDGKLVSQLEKSSHPFSAKGGGGTSPTSYILNTPVLKETMSNLNVNTTLRHKMDYLTQGLSVSGTISYNDTYKKGIRESQTLPQYTAFRNPDNPNEIIYIGGITGPTSLSDNVGNYKWNQLYLEAKLNYERTFDKHAVNGMLLYNARQVKNPSLEYHVPTSVLGLAGRVTYMFDNRYLAEVNIGYNGSENFPPGKRFGFFPAYSLGWIATNESFFPKNDLLSYLKIRGSYGEVGNDKIGGQRFLYLPQPWGTSDGYYFGNTDGSVSDPRYSGAYESIIGNPNVTWERSRKSNIGIDINFFKDRLSFSGDLFQEKRDNILYYLESSVSALIATTLSPSNIGKVSNKGFDLELNWRQRIRDFNYGIGVNVSYARNIVNYKDEPEYPYEWMNTTGFSLGQYKGYKTAGFYNNESEAYNRPYGTVDNNKVQPGDIRYVDIDGDGKIDNYDQVPIGYSNLPRYAFGGNINLGYKGFTIAVLFTASYQGSMPMSSFYVLNPFYQTAGGALKFQYDGRWTPEKAELGITPTYPRASMNNYSTQNGENNDLWLRSSEFIRLKNAEIGYEFKGKSLHRIGMSSARIYVSGNNLTTWGSKLISGYDPEQMDANGAADGYLYPPTKSFNIGVNIHF
jgi:TonB-linked SusC/RagA family outer membrane protein